LLQDLRGQPVAVPALVLALRSDFMYQDILGFMAFCFSLLLSMARFDAAVMPLAASQPGVREALQEWLACFQVCAAGQVGTAACSELTQEG
jgi:hypothetical protein